MHHVAWVYVERDLLSGTLGHSVNGSVWLSGSQTTRVYTSRYGLSSSGFLLDQTLLDYHWIYVTMATDAGMLTGL